MILTFLVAGALAQTPSAASASRSGRFTAELQVDGALATGAVSQGLTPVSPGVLACYDALLAQVPTATAQIALSWEVSAQGQPGTVQASAPDGSQAWFADCLKSATQAAKFATAAGATKVTWTLTFSPVSQDPMSLGYGGLIGARPTSEGGGPTGDGQVGDGQVGGDPIILGALDKSLIDEVIRRQMNRIRYCYQRVLTKKPTLAGKLVEKFVISKDGTVASAQTKTTTLNDTEVESCISGVFMNMQFPEPKGGGIVIVSYPFVFSPG